MRNDLELRDRILEELEWEPAIDASRIGESVNEGIVGLSGKVSTYIEKDTAERVVKRVRGVRGVAESLEVILPDWHQRTDEEIAAAAARALEWDVRVPHQGLTPTVRNGEVILDGEVDWQYQREAAEDAVAALMGVRAVVNRISVRPMPAAADLKNTILGALARSAMLDREGIYPDVSGGVVVLRGGVCNWRQREEAERIAWRAPGVVSVENELIVRAPIESEPELRMQR